MASAEWQHGVHFDLIVDIYMYIGYSVFIMCGGTLCPLLFVIVISGKVDQKS